MRAPHWLKLARGAFLVAAALYPVSGTETVAQQPPSAFEERETLEVSPATALSIIAQLLVSNRVDEAEAVLAQIAGKTPDPGQEAFLAAQIAIRQGRFNDALAIYDRLLVSDPKFIRIRVERARLLLAMGEIDQANSAFAELRREDLSDGLSSYVDRYINAIRQRQPWTFQAVTSALYDSNASAGPDQDTVTLFGLPFTLSPDARESEAWGANVAATGTYRWSLSDVWDLRAVAGFSHTDVEQRAFDDSLVTAQLTVSRVASNITVSAGPTVYRRWFGGAGLSTAWGAQTLLDFRLSPTMQMSAVLSVQDVDYDTNTGRDGTVTSLTGRLVKTLTPALAVYVYAGFAHEDATSRPLRNSVYRLGAGYAYRWDNGTRMTVRPEIALRDFEGVQPAFVSKRQDWRVSFSAEIKGPLIANIRLAPFVGYSFVHNNSSIDFNSYDRHQIRVGVSYEL